LACANRLWSGLEELIEAVERVLCQQNILTNASRFTLSKNFQ
jgi:hypothetical protein